MVKMLFGFLIPFFGTAIGAVCVFCIKTQINPKLKSILNGFASGVMIAASVWSLLIPSIERGYALGHFSFLPATAGLWIGVVFLWFSNRWILKLQTRIHHEQMHNPTFHRTILLVLAVVLHNIPEGMAVGAAFAGLLSDGTYTAYAAAFSLSIGIAIQNIPEGAIISMPIHAQGVKKLKAFACGVFSGIVEPIAAVITILLSTLVVPLLPYFLSFAAGAMIWVVISELIPESASDQSEVRTAFAFCIGFTVMMALDVALG